MSEDIRTCACCGKRVSREEMEFTTDCYGIPFRLVCFPCYEHLMDGGYDGQRYYDGIDECVDDYY